MRVPTFASADEEHAIPGVANHIAVVMKSEVEFVAGFCGIRKQRV